jgi:AcrR family transcriptional regulator
VRETVVEMPAQGRRERKKAATRQALADVALSLFIARGFDNVGVREIAEAADVSTGTLFKHFPTKESLVFDMDAHQEAALIAAVRERPSGQSIPSALHDFVRAKVEAANQDVPRLRQYRELVQGSEALRAYNRRMWLRHEKALAEVIADESDGTADPIACRALAHFALEARQMVYDERRPSEALGPIFALLENGWAGRR